MPRELDTFCSALAEALQADGFPTTRENDGSLIVNAGSEQTLKIFPERFLNRRTGQDVSLAIHDVLTEVRISMRTKNLIEASEPQLMGALWPHLTLKARAGERVVTRPVFGPLVEALSLNLPSHFAMLTTEALGLMALSVETAWALADAHRKAGRRAPNHQEPLINGAVGQLWTGNDAADQAWTNVSDAPDAYFAPVSSEHAWVAQNIQDVSQVFPLVAYVTEREPDSREHGLLPHVLHVEHGRITGSIQAMRLAPSHPIN